MSVHAPSPRGRFFQDTLIKGQPARIECIQIAGQTYSITRGPLTIVRLDDEWYEDVNDPAAAIGCLREDADVRADLFTFWQRLPDLAPRFPFHLEWEHVAALRVRSYDDWFSHGIKTRMRTAIRKAEKEGVVVKETAYDDAFVHGMTTIFNESPVRQGRPFWHYGKDFATVKQQFSRFVHREYMIGAYYHDQMIGFVMLGDAGRFGVTGQIISSIEHRDKGTNAALIAKSVEVCEKRGLEYLVYLFWTADSLSEFKRRCGFEEVKLPRYFVPLTLRGSIGLRMGVHRGWKMMLPSAMVTSLKGVRRHWYAWREK